MLEILLKRRWKGPLAYLVASREGQKAIAFYTPEQCYWQDTGPYLVSYHGVGTAAGMMDSVNIILPDNIFCACLDVLLMKEELA